MGFITSLASFEYISETGFQYISYKGFINSMCVRDHAHVQACMCDRGVSGRLCELVRRDVGVDVWQVVSRELCGVSIVCVVFDGYAASVFCVRSDRYPNTCAPARAHTHTHTGVDTHTH